MKLLFILCGIHYHVLVLGLNDKIVIPVAEKLSVRHQVKIWLPKGVITLLMLIDHIEHKCKLLPIALFLF